MTYRNGDWALFDADDTLIGLEVEGRLVGTGLAYEHCIALLCKVMISLGFKESQIRKTQFEIDRARCNREGFSRLRRFPISFRDTYRVLMKEAGRQPDPKTAEEIENLGWRVFYFKARPLPGAIPVLEKVAKHYNVAIITKGNNAHQVDKLRVASCLRFARKVVAMRTKDYEEWERKLTSRVGVPVERRHTSWVIGDSIKSDINPALRLGFNAIHIPAENWAFETAHYIKASTKLMVVKNIKEVLEHLPL